MLVTALLTACKSEPVEPAWATVELPGAAGATLRAAACGDFWYVAGALPAAGGTSRPAAWRSADAVTWTPVAFRPLPGSYYGPQQVISMVACADGRVTMLGGAPGGAHGNLRISSWRGLPDGRMAENPAPFETYGGDTAVDVAHLAAGPDGVAIAGNRSSGAAFWLSPDGGTFTLFENAPGLAGPGTAARDVVELPDRRWLVAGSRNGRAAAWTSVDGTRWSRLDPPDAGVYTELQRVLIDGEDVLAAGPHGTSFGVWRLHGGAWSEVATFGGAPTGVQSLTRANGRFVVSGGGLWESADARGWRAVGVPERVVNAAGRDRHLVVIAAGGVYRSG
ncbi:hypothetical protein GCM10010168_08970 [Actinoplanes ianthinogenes]|uniref:Galactose oxidase n=1 Tax=Actinoplanes ianthinogenes TaxID=122358 RepID=A0ABM7LXM5_9ACTN|nr:hypothetical protein Aiant_47410 [Actinoplanes ianthinogenes]GGQ95680.1 hypothetical protein GCM10010168_08970 [Actinoplanes ianthinogenes]